MKKKLPVGVRILLGFLSVLLCFVLFATTLATILVADLTLLTSKGSIQKLIKDMIFPSSAPTTITAVITPGRTPVRFEESDLTSGAQDAIVDALYGMLQEQFQGELPISKEQVEALVNDSTLPDYISDKVSGIVSDVISGETTTVITPEEIETLLEENKTLIEDTLHVELTPDVVGAVTGWVEQNDITETIQQEVSNITGIEIAPPAAPEASLPGQSGAVSGPSSNISAGLDLMDSVSKGEVEEFGLQQILVTVRFITAPAVLGACIAVCLLLTALLFLTNWGHPNAAMCCSGITYLVAGGLLLIPASLAFLAPALFNAMGVVGNAIRQALTLTASVSGGVTLLGLALIIGGAVLGSSLKKHAAAAAAAEESVEETFMEAPIEETVE
jgi:hypothetical protein